MKYSQVNTFHIPLDNQHSMIICKRMGGAHIGLYKSDSKGKRRGIGIPMSVWREIQTSSDIIELAIDLVQGEVASDQNQQDGIEGPSTSYQ
jgi:hypothetical protein